MNSVREVLEQTGINTSGLDRIRLARGVVGKASYVAAAAILVLGGVAWRLSDPGYLILVAALVVLVFVLYFVGVMWFANQHPGTALLEGAELIQWRHLEMIAKSGAPIASAPIPYEPDGKEAATK